MSFLFYIILMKKLSHWTDQEDKLLLEFYDEAGCFQKWKFISEKLSQKGFLKSEIQCRQRFVNKLNPDLRHDRLEKYQVQSLFQYYDQYGPLWSVFESLIPGRSQNLLKNKFYSTLRSLVRILFATNNTDSEQIPNVCSASLSSKLLVDIYEGKKNFRKYKGFLSLMLKKLNFQLDVQKSCFIKSQLNGKTIKNLKMEILNSIQAKNRVKRGGNKESIKNVENMKKKKIELREMKREQQILEQTREKVSEVKQSPLQALKLDQPSFGFFMTPMSSFSYFLPYWGFPIQNQTKLHQQNL